MLGHSVAALFGAYCTLVLSSLPERHILLLCALLAIGLAFVRRARCVASCLAGFVAMCLVANHELLARQATSSAANAQKISLTIIEMQGVTGHDDGGNAFLSLRFTAQPAADSGLPAKIRLNWFQPTLQPRPGERWQLAVRLRPPRGLSNPGSFDAEGWYFREGIAATGYVVDSAHNRRLEAAPGTGIGHLRRHMQSRLERLLNEGPARAVIKAVTLGERSEIDAAAWEVYARTGTSHLMAISGLHIGLAAGGAFAVGWLLLALWPGCRNLRAASVVVAVLAAFAYAELSGFAIPARRAFAMAALAALAILLRRRVVAAHVLGAVCLLVFVDEPLSILAPGFQLSFLAVALLIWWSQSPTARATGSADTLPLPAWHWRRWPRGTLQFLRLQWLLLLGLLALTACLFDRIAFAAPLINFLVLPLFSLLVVPSGLLGLVLDGPAAPAGDTLLVFSAGTVALLHSGLERAAALPYHAVQTSLPGPLLLILAGPTLLYALLPAGWPGRRLAILSVAACVVAKPPPVPDHCLEVTVLDVGQGLSVVLATASQVTVFDTGPGYRGGGSAAESVLLPFLRHRKVAAIETLVVSHGDLDHAGGLRALRAAIPVERILSGEPAETGGQHCRAGQAWQRDGVRFRILHPGYERQWNGNDSSCVLLAEIGSHRILIPGDIESAAELDLRSRGQIAAVDLLLIPHHGSRTSSQRVFVKTTSPSWAIASTGFGNRWDFPKPDVVERYRTAGATVMTTADSGAIAQRFCLGQAATQPREHRGAHQRYWHAVSETR